jgi:hypothetical protein
VSDVYFESRMLKGPIVKIEGDGDDRLVTFEAEGSKHQVKVLATQLIEDKLQVRSIISAYTVPGRGILMYGKAPY